MISNRTTLHAARTRAARAAVGALALLLWWLLPVQAAPVPARATKAAEGIRSPFVSRRLFTYRADGKRLADVLRDFAASQGMPAIVGDGLEGAVSGNFDMPAEGFLDTMAKAFGVLWYYDGASLYFYPGNAMQSRLFRLKGFSRKQVSDLLQSLELGDRRYPLRYSEEHRTLSVSGPPRHVELVSQAIEALDGASAAVDAKRVVRIVPLRYASASDRRYGETVVPGIASVLRGLYSGGTPSSATGEAPTGGRTLSARMKAMESMMGPSKYIPDATTRKATLGPDFKGSAARGIASPNELEDDAVPAFEADEGNNAVIVFAPGGRLRDIEAVIQRLDQRPLLVELEATIIDVREDSLTALGVEWSAAGARHAGAIGAPASTSSLPITPSALTLGTVVRNAGREFIARVQALQTDGKARIVSRPSVLGVANRPAVMRDRRVATVSVSGNLEANLFQIEAGTTLQVTPQITSADGSTWIKLSLFIEDGAFEQQVVDKVPVVKRTEIRTEAHVREGESLLIGGITIESDGHDRGGVPGLSRLPLIGALFRTDQWSRSRSERMFLITPRLRGTLTAAPVEPTEPGSNVGEVR